MIKNMPSAEVDAWFEKNLPQMRKVLEDVTMERLRQTQTEGFSPIHDDERNTNYELAGYGACMAILATLPDSVRADFEGKRGTAITRSKMVPFQMVEVFGRTWPSSWDFNWLKPKSRRHDLIRAIASLVAEVERLDRLALKK